MLDPPRARIVSTTRRPVSCIGVTFLIGDFALICFPWYVRPER
jgi:hypothetical protein